MKNSLHNETGISLIELLVGLAVGLIVLGVAGGALLASRGITGSVGDTSNIQQQASYALRIIGSQIRQAGSLEIELNPQNWSTEVSHLAPVSLTSSVQGAERLTAGTSGGNDSFTVGYRNYSSIAFDATAYEMRNCLGEKSNEGIIKNTFSFAKNELKCAGKENPQAIINNVAQFQVRYLQEDSSTPTQPLMSYVNASSLTSEKSRDSIKAIEICMVIYGNEAINLPDDASYTDCDNNEIIIKDIVDEEDAINKRKNRMHILFRNVFQLRSQSQT